MDAKEYEEMLKDAEKRLDRLRATYELYFQGMEKVEPTIQFKACERIFYVLMREKPRSTNLRFRANQLLQKWSTYQMYWKRVARQIEEGTYRKQIVKAKMKQARRMRAERPGAEAAAAEPELPAGQLADGSFEVSGDDAMELDMEEFSRQFQKPAKKPSERPVADAPAKVAAAEPARPAATAVTAVTAEPAREEHPPPTEDTGASAAYRPPSPKGLKEKKEKTAPKAPGLGASPPAGLVPPKAAEQAAAPKAVPAPPPMPTKASPPKPPAPPANKPAGPPPLKAAPKVVVAAQPPPLRPAPKPAVAAPAPPPGVRPVAGADPAVRQVYERYVDARKKNNERVDNVTFDKVEAQIKKMLPDLQKKHAGKRIEFDVVIKDGKVGLKPVAKG